MAVDNVCWFSGEEMKPWLVVPGDWRDPQARPGPFEVHRAESSEFAWVFPRPDAAEVAAFYSAADYYTHDEATPLEPRVIDRALRRAAWTFDGSVDTDARWVRATLGEAPCRFLDLGAGDGDFAAAVLQAGHDVTCVEPDPVCRERIASRGLTVVGGTAEDLPILEGAPFDAVSMLHVLEHTLDPPRALRNVRDALRPGGLLIVEVPNNRCLGFDRLAFTWAFFDVPRHLSFFTAGSLRNAVEHAGFVFERQELRGFTRQYLPEWILEEQRIHDALSVVGVRELPPRSTRRAAWAQLARALRLPPERRYDSVRIIARKAPAAS